MTALKRITAFCCLVLVWVLGFLPVPSAAQYNYTIKNFTNENGLSQNVVTDMAMDYSGYLWIGTSQGLIRYDGSSFKTFLLDNKPPDTYTNDVWSIMNTPFDRQLLVKSKKGWLYKIENGRPQLLDSSVKRDYAATTLLGQYPTLAVAKQFNLHQITLEEKLKWPLNVQVVPLNPTDFIMAGTADDWLRIYKGNQPPIYIPLPAHFRMLLRSQGNYLIVSDAGDVYLYDTLSTVFTKLKMKDGFKEIAHKAATNILPDFYHGLYSGECFMFQNNTMYLLHVNVSAGTVDFIPQFMLPARYGWNKVVYDSVNATFFLSSATQGIFKVKLQKIKTNDVNALLPPGTKINDYVNYAPLRVNDSTVITPGGFRFTTSDTGVSVKHVVDFLGFRQTIAALGDTAVLTQNPKGVYYYLHKENYRVPHVYNDSFNKVNKRLGEISLLLAEKDSVWVSCKSFLLCLTRSQFKNHTPGYTGKRNLKALAPLQLFYRISNNEALISNTNGFFKMTLSPKPVYEEVPGMEDVMVRHISPYKDVLIAAGYRKGLYILKNGVSYKVPMPAELEDLNTCHSTYIDKEGYIWITTNRGLFKSTAAAVVEAALKQGPAPYFFCYGRNDGIDNLEFNGGGMPAYAVLPGERLFYPSMGGIVTFKTGDLKDKVSNAPVIVENVFIDKKLVDKQDSIILPADFSVIDIGLSAVNLDDPRNLWIEYKLDNGDWERMQLGKEPQISLVKIAPGWHQLTIRKRTGFGNNDFVYTRLSIEREKKIQEQWWFFMAVFLLLAGLIGLLLQLRTRSLIKKREQLQELVNLQTEELSRSVEAKDMMIGIITHDMLTPLKHVSFIAAILEKGMEKDPQKITEALKDIKETSDKIHSGSQSIVNWMKYNNKKVTVNKQPLHLYSFTESVLAVYQPIAKSKNVSLVNNTDKALFIEADHNIFTTILTNIIANAIKHTAAGEIRVETKKAESDGKTILQVTDTGAGIREATLAIIQEVLKGNLRALNASSKVAPGLGYIIISELIKIHNLSVSIESTPGQGTTVSLLI